MTINTLAEFLLYCTLFNYGIVTIWFLLFYKAHDWLYRLHSRWFTLSMEKFDLVSYAGIALYKIGVLLFNLVPFLVLHFMGG